MILILIMDHMILCPQRLQYGYHKKRKIKIVFYMNLTFTKYMLTQKSLPYA